MWIPLSDCQVVNAETFKVKFIRKVTKELQRRKEVHTFCHAGYVTSHFIFSWTLATLRKTLQPLSLHWEHRTTVKSSASSPICLCSKLCHLLLKLQACLQPPACAPHLNCTQTLLRRIWYTLRWNLWHF